MAAHQVRALLMGGQACVFYGAAEFSRDADLLVMADLDNLKRLKAALDDLKAECIAVPPFSAQYLRRGHAVHFRCQSPPAAGIRVDVMSSLRGVDTFPTLWSRRTTIAERGGATYELMSLPDLVRAKKTQRSKDWPMVRRLLEAHYLKHRSSALSEQQRFLLQELRTPELLIEAVKAWPETAREITPERPLLGVARKGELSRLESALDKEEQAERERDRAYWRPLRKELERLRHAAVRRQRNFGPG